MTPSHRLGELGALALTAILFVVLPKPPQATVPMAVFIPTCVLGWGGYGAWRLRREPELWEVWGLSPRHHLRETVAIAGPLLALSLLGGVAWAVATDQPLWPPYIAISLLLYPLWGLVQQWLVQAILVDNARELTGAPLPALVLLGALGFGAVHVAFPLLVVATAIMGGVYVVLFQRLHNLYPLALCHGWLGSFFYPWVLHENPTAQMVGMLGAW